MPEHILDYSRHAVIEASAGTGKTYTIESIASELIGEGVPIDKILLVTFTEKATGELKLRIREKLEDSLKNGGGELFATALKDYGKAQISTIHAFCQKILTQYAFENNLLSGDYVITADCLT